MSELLLCRAEFTERLAADLDRVAPDAEAAVLAPGLVAAARLPATDLPFARQRLPGATRVEGCSVRLWAQAIFDAIAARGELEAPWRLHVYGTGLAVAPSRPTLIEDALDALLKKRRRSWRRTRRDAPPGEPFQADEVLVQAALLDAERGAISIASPGVWGLDPWPGGIVSVDQDKRPPSRAYRKLLEVELRTGQRIQPGARCVDLGASPGGWTFVAVERGASVVAVDRSPLRADLMGSSQVTFVKGDAFRWFPEAPVDWLVCDVAAAPARNLAMLQTWLDAGHCSRAAVTLKLKGAERDGDLDAARALVEAQRALGRDAWVRQLDANHNEVTVWVG